MLLETPIERGFLFVIGIFAGVLSGLMGVGGGLLIVPSLTVFGVPVVQATATSLVGVFLSTTSGSVRNLSVGDLNWKASLTMALFGVITAQMGAFIGDRIPDAWLSLSFGVFLLVTIYLMNLRKQLQQKESELETDPCELGDSSTPSNRFVPLVGIGVLAGVLSGLFGIGGGVVKVPLQMLFLGESIKTAVQTSLGAISAIAVSGLAQHAYNHNVLWIPGLCLGMGGIIGAQVGTRLLPKLSDRTVKIIFIVFLVTLSVYMSSHGILELASQTNSLKLAVLN
ncbi:sulfite exporter TauE/SafE family protein [Scytonema hofmannii FACHB-248]|uniref:Probable membrane transporter protein n=1 Tax=Scytonema hofmannii FACHB-248 TaxID=1842502 RepID=A0ABR8GZZ2_9CYAN|nr:MULTISPECIES: sulfite exporter TauE/SafE family protein [Nostocales]MBD2608581.1 sulfite exporter TauE/SafE family protein [Scytonema hofmannii FACHB-248]